MASHPSDTELERIEELLRLEIPGRPADQDVQAFVKQIERLPSELLRILRTMLGRTLSEREASHQGHLHVESLRELVDRSRVHLWLMGRGLSEAAAINLLKGLQRRKPGALSALLRSDRYVEWADREPEHLLIETGLRDKDVRRFLDTLEEAGFTLEEPMRTVFAINYGAEVELRSDSLRGAMSLKELIAFYLYGIMEVDLSAYGLDEDLLHELAARIGLGNNMLRQCQLVRQLERYCFGLPHGSPAAQHSREHWIHRINEFELKIALEQYVSRDKLLKSDMELAELYVEVHHIFADVGDLDDETLAVISITYRLDNPEETGHTVEELLSMIDQIKLLTTEFSPLGVLTRDIFAFFEILGECDHHNPFFHKTIVNFRSRLRRLAASSRETGERPTLILLILTYLYARLDAFLDDYELNETEVLEGIRGRLAQCTDPARQFAIVDAIEQYLAENPGLLQIADDTYWPELINTLELNIILKIYIDRAYLVPGTTGMNKNQMLDHLQTQINRIPDLSVKSLTVTFVTAHLATHLEQSREQTLSIGELSGLIDTLRQDAEHAAVQITVQSRVKRELLSALTERVYRLEAIQHALHEHAPADLLHRLDEVVVGLRTRRDNLIEGKMDPHVLEKDIRDLLTDPKVVKLVSDAELQYREILAVKSH